MSKYTSGPWEVLGCLGTIYPGRGFHIGPDHLDDGSHTVAVLSTYADKEVQQANARLIAAAPELLEALEEIERAYSMQRDHGYRFEFDDHAHDCIRKVIAKAKGV